MEGTLDSRLILQRPEPRQNVVEDRNTLRISHTRPAAAPAEPATPVATAAPPQPAAPVASVAPTPVAPQPQVVPAVIPAPQPVTPQAPSFSQVTPVYAPTPKNTPADIVQPPVKSMEWVQKPYVQPVAPSTPVQPAVPAVTPQPAVVVPAQVTPEPVPAVASPEAPSVSSKLDVIEKNISDVDLDQMIDTRNPQSEAELPSSAYSNPFVIPATPQPAAQPSVAPVASAPAVTNPVTPAPVAQPVLVPEVAQPAASASAFDQYFQNTAPAATKSTAGFASNVGATFGVLKSKLKANARATAIVAIVAVVGMGSYVLADSLLINQRAKQTLATETTEQTPAPVFGGGVVDEEPEETQEEAEPVVEEETTDPTPATANSGVNLSVAPEAPRSIVINKLGINAPVIGLGLTSGGAIDTPANIWHAGWYNKSAKPGTTGATFIDGHSSAEGGALFGQLNKLIKGDTFQVVRGDGKAITYVVVEKKRVDRNNVDMASMLRPYGNAEHGLNIMTCIGDWIPAEQTLTDRLLVYAIEV